MKKISLKVSSLLLLIFILLNLLSCKAQWNAEVLHSFNGKDGATPKGSLTLVDNSLYGCTSAGGKDDKGVIFKVNTDGTGFKLLYEFKRGENNGLGKEPHHGAMVYNNGFLYGTTCYGGNNDNGVIFKINPDGSDYTPIHVFNGNKDDGGQPHNELIFIEGVIYGLTAQGGEKSRGVLYKINPDGTNFTILYSFLKPSGDESHGILTLGTDGHTLYGITKNGGDSNLGVIFSFDLSTSTYKMMHSFTGGKGDGSTSEHGFLTLYGNTLYGMTHFGNNAENGVIFSINEDGSDFKILHSFGESKDDGNSPFGSLILSNGYFYGITQQGGENDRGTVFRIKPDGKDYEILFSFDKKSTGEYPIDNVVINDAGNELYFLGQEGGEFDEKGKDKYGTVLKLSSGK